MPARRGAELEATIRRVRGGRAPSSLVDGCAEAAAQLLDQELYGVSLPRRRRWVSTRPWVVAELMVVICGVTRSSLLAV